MNTQRAYHSGDIYGFYYEFQGIGSKLPMHSHSHNKTHHNVIVLHGHVKVYGPDFDRLLLPGDVFDFDGDKLHTIMAVSVSARILNIYLHGKPNDWVDGYVGSF